MFYLESRNISPQPCIFLFCYYKGFTGVFLRLMNNNHRVYSRIQVTGKLITQTLVF